MQRQEIVGGSTPVIIN